MAAEGRFQLGAPIAAEPSTIQVGTASSALHIQPAAERRETLRRAGRSLQGSEKVSKREEEAIKGEEKASKAGKKRLQIGEEAPKEEEEAFKGRIKF